jgi:hypothetical protein
VSRVLSAAVLALLALAPLPGLGQRDGAAPEANPGEIILRGRIRLVGSALFSSLVLTDEEGQDWYLEGADRELLAPRDQQEVSLRGTPEYQDLILANGQKAGVRRFLRNVSLEEG